MYIAAVCDPMGPCRIFGPFKTELAARDWALEAKELGFYPRAIYNVYETENPIDLGYDPGL